MGHLLYAVDASLPLDERIAEVVQQRAAIWEALAPVRRAALSWASSSPTLRTGNLRMADRAVKDIARVFAVELEGLGADRRTLLTEALHVATSSGAWEVLRTECRLSVDDASSVVAESMRAVLATA